MLAAHDLFDLREPLLIMRQNRLAHNLILLKLPDDIAIIGKGPAVLLRELRRDLLHLTLHFGEQGVGSGGEFGGRNIDANVLEIQRINLRWEAKIFAALRQDFFLHEFVIGSELFLYARVGVLITFYLVFREELSDAIDVDGSIGQVFFDLGAGGSQQTGRG